MMTIRKAAERGHANHGWLDAWHTFSFADYQDPKHTRFRTLRVLNDDTLAPGGGFDMHPHRDMEILTYILSGALEHKDSMGNGRIIRAGEFQYMAAGTGVLHSEFNPSPDESTHLLQVWIFPDRQGHVPRYAERSPKGSPTGGLELVASGDGRNDSIAMHQDADIWLARLEPGDTAAHAVKASRHVWVHVAEGAVEVNGKPLVSGDGAGLSGEDRVTLRATGPSRVLLFDLN